MAEFPPNLDDGELWLPSDIFLNEVPFKYRNPYHHFSCMEDRLAKHFAALSLLRSRPAAAAALSRRPLPKPAPVLQRIKPAIRGVPANHLPPGCFGLDGGAAELGPSLHEYGTRRLLARSEPLYEFGIRPKVDGYLETRPRILQRQQNHPQNRVYPYGANGLGFDGGFVRPSSGGTGVFHPRILKSASTDSKRKQGVPNVQDIQVAGPRNSTRRVGVSKQEDCYYHLPPEMGLPHDWTY